MTIDQVIFIFKLIGALGVFTVVIGSLGYFALKAYLIPYLNEKAKNLATREDVADLTHAVEKIRAEYATLIEVQKARHQLRLAGIDKRLQVHQESFIYWRDLFRAMHTPEVNEVAGKCSLWWEANCLYLEPAVRKAFAAAYVAANSHASLLQDRTNADLVQQNWAEIIDFPKILFESIQLPGLSEKEFMVLEAGRSQEKLNIGLPI